MMTQTYKIPRFVISNRRSTPEGAKVNFDFRRQKGLKSMDLKSTQNRDTSLCSV